MVSSLSYCMEQGWRLQGWDSTGENCISHLEVLRSIQQKWLRNHRSLIFPCIFLARLHLFWNVSLMQISGIHVTITAKNISCLYSSLLPNANFCLSSLPGCSAWWMPCVTSGRQHLKNTITSFLSISDCASNTVLQRTPERWFLSSYEISWWLR